ncbi:type III secretion protein [Pseudomonas sp. CNPSo 3701]|uniref:type III secretion protein n=1 Tax=Pseudomonas sp. CNPSo 3701 TaxID=3027943 RepID=UPI0023635935|nr:type III secretion protein [Pseudomonas sp. CNPSo 3701]MDD1510198.1 type III secretion protein [Pseudomonas sp. CNPSo 3701]
MSQALRDAWSTLLAQPIRFVAQECLEAALLGAVPRDRVSELIRQRRFEARLAELLASYYGLQPLSEVGEVADDDLPVLLLPPSAFAELAMACGACRHAHTLAREIRGPQVQQLRERLGDATYDLAVDWRDAGTGAPAPVGGAALLAAIETDGQRCVEAWLAVQPITLQAWLRLRFGLAAPLANGSDDDVRLVRQVALALGVHVERGAA